MPSIYRRESDPRRLLCATDADRCHGLAMFPVGPSPARRSGSEISDPVRARGRGRRGTALSGMPLAAADNADLIP